MKRSYIIAALITLFTTLSSHITSSGQTLSVTQGSVTIQYTAEQAGEMTYSGGGSLLTIDGKTYSVDQIDQITIDERRVTDNTVSVAYSGTTANVVIAGNIAQYITAEVSGAHVSITQGGIDDNTGKVEYTLSGMSSDGEFYLKGSYKMDMVLDGLTLNNPSGPAIYIDNGKKINVSVKKGTTNTLSDGTGGEWKGAFRVKGHTELKGKGTLNIQGNSENGFWGKEFLEIKNCTLNITGAIKDGINVNQHFTMSSGELNISNVGDDGLQVSYKTDDNDNIIALSEDEDNTGALTVSGGTINIATSSAGSKGMKAEGAVCITESDDTTVINIANSGTVNTNNSTSKDDWTSSCCLKSDTSVTIDGGTLTLTSTGSGGRAMNCEKTITINGGSINARAEGSNYGSSGNTRAVESAGPGGWGGGGQPGGQPGGRPGDQSSANSKNAKGIKAKAGIIITGGDLSVYSASHEGLESKGTMTISGGTIYVEAYDDAINSSGDMTIDGGYVYGYSHNNDGIDSNGNLTVNGGVLIGFGASEPEAGIDIDEQHYLRIYGGYLFGIGGRMDTGRGIQGSQKYSSNVTASTCAKGSYYIISSGSAKVFAVKTPASYNGKAICSAPAGSSFTLSTASSVNGTEINGFAAF